MTNLPFIGVCGLQQAVEYSRLLNITTNILRDTGRFVMVGVKDIDGDLDTITPSSDVRLFVHCDHDRVRSYSDVVFDRLQKSSVYAQGVQLNVVPWMESDYTKLWKSIRRKYPDTALMLQVHEDIMRRYTPEQIASRLRMQQVDYVLFDASQSRGIPYDPTSMAVYVKAVYGQNPSIRVVVSGGLAPHTIQEMVTPLTASFPELSIDAFFHLHDPLTKRLSWPAVEAYLDVSRQVLPPFVKQEMALGRV